MPTPVEHWTPIARLWAGCRPAAVAGLIVAVVIGKPVETLARRARSHIGQEVFEAVAPAAADRDAAIAVIVIILIVRIRATVNHRYPGLIFWGNFFKSRVTVL
jgi:hypothetical protein